MSRSLLPTNYARQAGMTFLFKGVQDGHYEIMNDVVLVIGGLLLFLVSCNLICSIRDGEGTFKQMYCGPTGGSGRAWQPYL